MVETKYGIISDIHQDPRVVPIALKILKKEGAQRIILNGDIGNNQDFVGFILNSVGKSGLESFVQPGSHEKLIDFEPVIDYFQKKYPNLVNIIENRKIENPDYHLIFMPGSDWRAGGEYLLAKDNSNPSGIYNTQEGRLRLTNINDLRGLVTAPEKTIVMCHIPRKFDNIEEAVDMAEFGEALEDFELQGKEVNKGSVFPLAIAQRIIEAGYLIDIKKENRGNKDLRDIYEELEIRKSVSGHFHESGHRANDRQSRHVKEGELVDELF